MMRHNILTTLLLALILSTTLSHADPSQVHSHNSIIDAARRHLADVLGDQNASARIEVKPLDHRLRLNPCEKPLDTFLPSGSKAMGKTTVGVRCIAPKPWTLYVTANIAVQGSVVVSTRDLSRGSTLGASDVKLIERDTSNLLRGHFDSLSQVTGRTLRRNLRRDQVVTPGLLVVHKIINRGQEITIIAGSPGIEVRMKGKAMRNGNPGEVIPIQNLSSNKKLDARVVSAGTVRVD